VITTRKSIRIVDESAFPAPDDVQVPTRLPAKSLLGSLYPEKPQGEVTRRTSGPVHPLRLRPPVDLEIIVPALNEERRLASTIAASVEHLAAQPWTSAIVVVDNGSVDRTSDVVRQFSGRAVPVSVIGCARLGKGAAVRRGIVTSTAGIVGFMDADLATPIETIDRVLPLLATGCDAVIGSRHAALATLRLGQPLHRRVGGWAFRRLSRQLLSEFADTQCGFKFFRREVIAPLVASARVDGFAFDVEMLAQLVYAGHRVVEIPVDWTNDAASTFSAWRHGWTTFHDVLRLAREGQPHAGQRLG
jgi:dolichyl-phosphate beta-glucosyltransferase